jgi:hypothetical protein|tara:strand:+ start:353 stop:652 length:300 start_codon:yes stop_codon:yes gene_type:complete
MKREYINNYLEENYPDQMNEILVADGFEDAFMGVVETFGQQPRSCYDSSKCINILIERDGMTTEEAVEYFEFNVTGAYVGEFTPAFIHLFDEKWDSVSA